MIVWQGPSRIDPEQEVVCIVTGFNGTSNPKTGQMLQSWILHAHHHPAAALKSGYDYAICGRCPHRPDPFTGKRSCYVNIMGPSQVWNKYKRGGYEKVCYQNLDIQNFVGVQFASGRTEIQPQCHCGYGSLFVTILTCTRDTHINGETAIPHTRRFAWRPVSPRLRSLRPRLWGIAASM